MFPVGRDAFLPDIFQPDSLVLKYSLTQGESGSILYPVSTCLPFGRPNHLATLQDHCSVIPLAVQTQEWLQGFTKKRLPSKRNAALPGKRKASTSLQSALDEDDNADTEAGEDQDVAEDYGNSDEEHVDGESTSATSESFESSEEEDIKDIIFRLQEPTSNQSDDELMEEERIVLPPSPVKKATFRSEPVVEVDSSLPFDELAHLPNFKYIKPLRKDQDKIRGTYLSTRAAAGVETLPPLNSSINWWYSGGNLAHLTCAEDRHFLLHTAGGSFRQ
ncbi:hypothetical protein RvY_18827 [Ramazzottius varieornatus]|uniref:Uncharacterized protein n=1 Tax=Ramazzottius varieornatus TaxID=947166 RepID=A0A1D1W7F8_RAMVA|nr:hypothetical protein RvY_18827 [Ramazzottius varieornatus]